MNKDIKHIHLILGISIIIDIIILDQLTKWWITEHVLRAATGQDAYGLWEWVFSAPERLGFISVPVFPSFNLTMVWNEGVSFGLFQNAGIWPLVVMTSLITAVLCYWMLKARTNFEVVSFGLIIGGAIGNIIDRFRFGAVADFFDVYVGTYHWPAFNIADSAITIGVVLLLVHSILCKAEEDNS